MGSVKNPITDGSLAGRLYILVTPTEFGRVSWGVGKTFSIGDLKYLIPNSFIENKQWALPLQAGRFFEHLANKYPNVKNCWLGLMDHDGKVVDTQTLLDRGELSNIIVMKLAFVPETYSNGNLEVYRKALASGQLQCGVADIESIFRMGFPLGSSTFEKIFKAVGWGKEYERIATYNETVAALDDIRGMVKREGLSSFPSLERILQQYGLGTRIPNPGFVLEKPVYDSTTKFEVAGDRTITKEEERELSGLSDEGYQLWTEEIFPAITETQIAFAADNGVINIDGKGECVAFKGMPWVTDLYCTTDENRLMITEAIDGVEWAIPASKEIQRAVFRREGVYAAINEAKRRAIQDGDVDKWRGYMPQTLQEKRIDLQAITNYSCELMSAAIGEVTNRLVGQEVFDVKLAPRLSEFLPYASRIERQVCKCQANQLLRN